MREHLALIQEYRKESEERRKEYEASRKQNEELNKALIEALNDLRFMVNQVDRKVMLQGKERFPWET